MIDRNTLHPITWNALVAAGWYLDRNIETEKWQHFLRTEEVHWLDSADRFLAVFGGLTLKPFRSDEMKFGRGMCTFDPLCDDGQLWYTEFYEELLGTKLCPIGVWEQEALLVNAEMQVFAGWENDYLLLLGATPQEAVEVIVRAHVYPKVLYGETWWSKDM